MVVTDVPDIGAYGLQLHQSFMQSCSIKRGGELEVNYMKAALPLRGKGVVGSYFNKNEEELTKDTKETLSRIEELAINLMDLLANHQQKGDKYLCAH